MKRKATAQPPTSAISAVAARRNKQKLADNTQSTVTSAPDRSAVEAEPPSKRPKSSVGQTESKDESVKEAGIAESADTSDSKSTKRRRRPERPAPLLDQEEETIERGDYVSLNDAESFSTTEGSDSDTSSEPQTTASQKWEDFLLSRSRIGKKDIVYTTHDAVCLRLKLKSTLVIVGQYALWVKSGVVSILGAKLHATDRLHRVYAPSTHSLPVIKCVSGGVHGYAEIELQSCNNGLGRLGNISNLYHRIWYCEHTIPRRQLECDRQSTFTVVYSASDDPFRRLIRPLHVEKRWSVAIKVLSQRSDDLRVLTCGPKGSGKSTFNKYLVNHLLSIPLSPDAVHSGRDGVAFLDLDPGQPEFSTTGHIYLAHLRSPVLGPPLSHPTIDGQGEARTIRSHYIGATSPKDDSEHYVMTITDLMECFQSLRLQYPQCPLIINYPGWIFGQGLETAIWLVNTLGLSDVVYMSDKGPEEVVEPLGAAASQSGVPMTVLPSQPTEYVSRSSSQLRTMQMLSYFHSSIDSESGNPTWNDIPLVSSRHLTVDYSGDKQGLFGIATPGFPYEPGLLHDLLNGALVGVVAIESVDAIAWRKGPNAVTNDSPESVDEVPMDESDTLTWRPSNVVRTKKEQLPYLFIGSGTCAPPDPRRSYSLGLAIIRAINTDTKTLELLTPISAAAIRNALDDGHQIILLRGQVDRPNWAISEEYFAARAMQDRHRKFLAQQQQQPQRRSNRDEQGRSATAQRDHDDTATRIRERIRQAANVPWICVPGWDDERGKTQRRNHKPIWKLGKDTDPVVESSV